MIVDIKIINESSLIIYFGNEITPENGALVSQACNIILKQLSSIVIDYIPSYCSLHLSFDISRVNILSIRTDIQNILNCQKNIASVDSGLVIEIPSYYDEEVGLDLNNVAEESGLSIKEVIECHSQVIYQVYAIGFAPGFAYMGNVDKGISLPRKKTPRTKVPKGSIAIAESQTAIYPTESPGGWHILARTPIELIDFNSENLTPLSVGNRVKFVPINRIEYLKMGGVL
jgi:KipI family sensor histidine kinase inhibitor